ncbi:MAG: hypothetical protein MJA82_15190 [Clostridia bacterium]|nr:hypothetical protein [Clostridia bacterium]
MVLPWQEILERAGIIVGVTAAFVIDGGNPNTFIGKVVAVNFETEEPIVRVLLTQDFGVIPTGTLITIIVTELAAFGPITDC